MLKQSSIFSNDNILSTISETIKEISVFIQPSGVISPKKDIEDLELTCNDEDINAERLLIEVYTDIVEAKERVDEFIDYKDFYYVSIWNKGTFIYSNIEKEN